LNALASRLGLTDIREHIREERMITPSVWRDSGNIFEGATFNLAHNWPQLIYLRPRNRLEEFENCYLAGGGTHPGSGLPTIYQSGRIAANLITGS
jgi:phytoene desaturase